MFCEYKRYIKGLGWFWKPTLSTSGGSLRGSPPLGRTEFLFHNRGREAEVAADQCEITDVDQPITVQVSVNR